MQFIFRVDELLLGTAYRLSPARRAAALAITGAAPTCELAAAWAAAAAAAAALAAAAATVRWWRLR